MSYHLICTALYFYLAFFTGTYLYPYYGKREFHLEHGAKDEKRDHCNSGRDYYMAHQGGNSIETNLASVLA